MRAATLLRLENSIKEYAWGDARRLPELFGLENPDGAPQAEIWMGAHPADPSRVRVDGELQALDGLIASDPGRILGADVAARFDGRLPFLFKVLNAGQPLSIQLHPDKATAEAGFARENEAGIPLDASHRNYADPNHKPELICALTPFRALCGFRPYEEICAALTLLDAPQLDDALQRLRDEPGSDALKALCLTLLDLGQNDVSALLEIALQRAVEVEREDFNELCLLHEYYPGDRGVLFALLLNRVELQPGEALFLGAGNVHSYLGGVGLEIMASSDNVIRGGLTGKHVDRAELARLASFEPLPRDRIRVVPRKEGPQTVYPTPVEDFTLALVDVAATPASYAVAAAEILFAISGEVLVSSAGQALQLAAGQACLVTAAAGAFELSGEGRVARAAVVLPD